jgi:hypothetical protein
MDRSQVRGAHDCSTFPLHHVCKSFGWLSSNQACRITLRISLTIA